jgi:hypothetical protein
MSIQLAQLVTQDVVTMLTFAYQSFQSVSIVPRQLLYLVQHLVRLRIYVYQILRVMSDLYMHTPYRRQAHQGMFIPTASMKQRNNGQNFLQEAISQNYHPWIAAKTFSFHQADTPPRAIDRCASDSRVASMSPGMLLVLTIGNGKSHFSDISLGCCWTLWKPSFRTTSAESASTAALGSLVQLLQKKLSFQFALNYEIT